MTQQGDPVVGSDLPSAVDVGLLPPRFVPAAAAVGDIPVRVGNQLTLGARVGGRGGPIYFLAGPGALTRRYSRQFPLTAEGWEKAWAEFAAGDPDAASAYQQALLERARAARVPRPAPNVSPPSQGPSTQPEGSHAHRVPANAFAIAALVMGFWCFTIIGAVLALIFSAIALDQIKESGERGRSLAHAAIILGIVGLIVGLVAIIVIWTILANSPTTNAIVYPG